MREVDGTNDILFPYSKRGQVLQEGKKKIQVQLMFLKAPENAKKKKTPVVALFSNGH